MNPKDHAGLPLVASPSKFRVHLGPAAAGLSAEVFEFVPWGDRVVVVRAAPMGRTPGGIIIPKTAQEYPSEGWILSLGPDAEVEPYERPYLLGCKVVFGAYAGSILNVGDVDDFQDPFNSRYTIMDVGSLWGLVGAPPTEPLL